MGVVWLTLIALFAVCQATPLPSRLKYDQKQEGGLNIRADLENFVILVIPTSSSSAVASAANVSLLDFLAKTIPLPYYKKPKKHLKIHHQQDSNLHDTEQFIESKTAPYHVDISRTRSHLAKLHPDVTVPEGIKEEIIIARSPSVALSKSPELSLLHAEGRNHESLRTSRAFLITVPMENENIQRHGLKDVVGGKGNEDFKKTLGLSAEAVEEGLLAAQIQQNSPKGNIQTLKTMQKKPETPNNDYNNKLEKLAEEIKNNKTVNHAVVLAKTIQAGLVEYFRKVAEKLKAEQEAEKKKEEEEEEKEENVLKLSSALRQKVRQTIAEMKEKEKEKTETVKGEKEKIKNGVENMPKLELEPPKMPEVPIKDKADGKFEIMKKPTKQPNKNNSKDELLLLGAVNEQCGPGRERDSSGICVAATKA